LSRIEAERAFALMKSLVKVLEVRSESLYLEEAFRMALETELTIYDSLYVAAARSEKRPLLTLDKVQREVAERLNIPVLPIE